MLINPKTGSFIFLAALLTNATLQANTPFENDHCGTCTACLDACPTDAFVAQHVLDARKCISYLTIELRKEIPLDLRPEIGDWLFGCDICQEVCPWNRFAGQGPSSFPVRSEFKTLDCLRLLEMSEEQFRTQFKGTSFKRTKWAGLLRNAAIVLGNRGDHTAIPVLQKAASLENAVIREAAQWAIAQIQKRLT